MDDRADCGTDLVEKKTRLKNILSEIKKTRRKGLAGLHGMELLS